MFEIDLKSRKSIYEQVMDNLKEAIMSGKIAGGDKLPSVRELSKSISVNPNTVQKAYRELERQGYIYTQSGLGTFVADKSGIICDSRELDKIKSVLHDSLKQILYLGLDFETTKGIVYDIIEKLEKEGIVK